MNNENNNNNNNNMNNNNNNGHQRCQRQQFHPLTESNFASTYLD